MFSAVSVILFWGSYMTITRDALEHTIQDLTVQGHPRKPVPPPDMFKLVQLGPHCTRALIPHL